MHHVSLPCHDLAGKSALMYAVQYQHESLVNYLSTRRDIALDAVDTDGYTALVLAVEMGEQGLDMAKALLVAGASPNVSTFRRKTALKIACAKQDMVMVRASA